MTILDDWKKFVQGEAEFDSSHFVGLFKNEPSEAYIWDALSSVEQGEDLATRIINAIKENDQASFEYLVPKKENILDAGGIRDIVENVCQDRKKFIAENGNISLSSEIYQKNILYVRSSEEFDRYLNDVNLPMPEIEDFIRDSYNENLRRTKLKYIYGLKTAVTYMTQITAVTRFMLDPLANFSMDTSKEYELWKSGGVFVIGDEKVYFSIVPNS